MKPLHRNSYSFLTAAAWVGAGRWLENWYMLSVARAGWRCSRVHQDSGLIGWISSAKSLGSYVVASTAGRSRLETPEYHPRCGR